MASVWHLPQRALRTGWTLVLKNSGDDGTGEDGAGAAFWAAKTLTPIGAANAAVKIIEGINAASTFIACALVFA
jgi:hypothetical protein